MRVSGTTAQASVLCFDTPFHPLERPRTVPPKESLTCSLITRAFPQPRGCQREPLSPSRVGLRAPPHTPSSRRRAAGAHRGHGIGTAETLRRRRQQNLLGQTVAGQPAGRPLLQASRGPAAAPRPSPPQGGEGRAGGRPLRRRRWRFVKAHKVGVGCSVAGVGTAAQPPPPRKKE